MPNTTSMIWIWIGMILKSVFFLNTASTYFTCAKSTYSAQMDLSSRGESSSNRSLSQKHMGKTQRRQVHRLTHGQYQAGKLERQLGHTGPQEHSHSSVSRVRRNRSHPDNMHDYLDNAWLLLTTDGFFKSCLSSASGSSLLNPSFVPLPPPGKQSACPVPSSTNHLENYPSPQGGCGARDKDKESMREAMRS